MSQQRVLAELWERIARAKVGDKLPTIRALMRDLRVSQPAVQEALRTLTGFGLVTSHVGRGTFVARTNPVAPRPPTVLVLSGRTQSDRNHRVATLLLGELSKKGARSLQVVYDRLDHAIEVLQAGPAFDLSVIQPQLEIVPVRLLEFLQRGGRPVVIDGSRLSGIDVDIVSSNWRAALDLGLGALREAGHRRIGFLTWPSPARTMEGLRRHFESLRGWMGWDRDECPLILLDRSPEIGEPSAALIEGALKRVVGRKPAAVTALAIWGGNDASGIAEALQSLSLQVPQDLSVVVIAHTDLESMHLGRFSVAGPSASQTAALLADVVIERSTNLFGEVRTTYVDTGLLLGHSIASL